MSQQELLKSLVVTLERIGVEYMLTGSLVSSLQGQPRSTHDIDVVVKLRSQHTAKLLAAFPSPRFYLSDAGIRDAIKSAGMFNRLDIESGEKVDFWILTREPFDPMRFARRRFSTFAGVEIAVTSPEDTILSKLRWAKKSGGSEKQFGDALHVLELKGRHSISII